MIIVIGSINLDLIVDAARLPRPGETVTGEAFRAAPGGKGANQALAAARAGASVRMIGAVGSDALARPALALLAEGGVDLTNVQRTDLPTGVAQISVDANGENAIIVVAGANSAVRAADVALANISAADIVLLQHEVPLDTVAAALAFTREAGAVSILNTAPVKPQGAHLLAEADYVITNEMEFEAYAGILQLGGPDRLSRMREFAGMTGRTIIVTLGRNGLEAATPEETMTRPALPLTPVDTVGAGDTFCGYFAASLAEGLSLENALTRAVFAASLACLKRGAQPSIPFRAEVDAVSQF